MASLTVGQALVSRWFVHRVGVAMGLSAFGAALPGVVFPMLVVWALPQIGWRHLLEISAGAIAFLALPAILIVARNRPTLEEGADYVGERLLTAKAPTLTYQQILSRRNFWITILVFLSLQIGFQSVLVNFAPLAMSYGATITRVGILLTLMNVSALVAKLTAGLAADRWGNRLPLVIAASSVALGQALLLFSGSHGGLLFPALLLIGITGATWTLLASATVAEFGADNFGRAYGLVSGFTPICIFCAPLLARVKEVTGAYTPGLILLLLIAIAGALIGLQLEERPKSGRRTQVGGGSGATPTSRATIQRATSRD